MTEAEKKEGEKMYQQGVVWSCSDDGRVAMIHPESYAILCLFEGHSGKMIKQLSLVWAKPREDEV